MGKVNVHSSRHALIGLFGHCPEAKLIHMVKSKAQIFNIFDVFDMRTIYCITFHTLYL